MPTLETIEKGLPTEVIVLVKVPHWAIDQGRVYYQKKVSKDLFLPMANLLENGYIEKDKLSLQDKLKDLKDSFNELASQKKALEKELEYLSKEKVEIEKARDKFLKAVKSA